MHLPKTTAEPFLVKSQGIHEFMSTLKPRLLFTDPQFTSFWGLVPHNLYRSFAPGPNWRTSILRRTDKPPPFSNPGSAPGVVPDNCPACPVTHRSKIHIADKSANCKWGFTVMNRTIVRIQIFVYKRKRKLNSYCNTKFRDYFPEA